MAARHGLANDQPHSFVLADHFDVVSLEQTVPDDVYEADPLLEWVCCPTCQGEKWLETNGNAWIKGLEDPRLALVYGHLNKAYKPCLRCNGVGEVLDSPSNEKYEVYESCPCKPTAKVTAKHPQTPETPTVDKLIARVEYLLAVRREDEAILYDALQGRR